MNQEIKSKIREYLCSPRDYDAGVELYRRYGNNLRIMRELAAEETSFTRSLLFDELRQIAGISDREFAALPRLARIPRHLKKETAAEMSGSASGETETTAATDDATGPADSPGKASANSEAPETVTGMIRFRDKYPFLDAPDCPDDLKVLVADMFTAYGKYKEAHARLTGLADDDREAAATVAREIVENYLENREIREELDYFREHRTILGKSSLFRNRKREEDLSQLSDIELMKRVNSASANVSKRRKEVAGIEAEGGDADKARAALRSWIWKKEQLTAEIERRKKK